MKRILSLVAMLTLLLSATALASTPSSVHQHKWDYVISSENTMYYVDINEENILYPISNIMVFFTKYYDKDKNTTVINKWATKIENDKFYARNEWERTIDNSAKRINTTSNIGAWKEFNRKTILFKCTLYLCNSIRNNKGAVKK